MNEKEKQEATGKEKLFDTTSATEVTNKKYYHVSEKKSPFISLTPRIPSNHFTRIGAEDKVTPRICVSSSIDGALIALGKNLQGKVLYVYELDDYKGDVVTNSEIRKRKLVPDAKVTGEVWLLKPAKLRQVAVVKVYESKSHPYRFTYDHDGRTREARTYGWIYRKMNEKKNDSVSQKINRRLSGIVTRRKQ